jgi:hypothetical protein
MRPFWIIQLSAPGGTDDPFDGARLRVSLREAPECNRERMSSHRMDVEHYSNVILTSSTGLYKLTISYRTSVPTLRGEA